MLQLVDVGQQELAPYYEFTDAQLIDRIREVARGLAGARVLHLSATPYGGGVSELLHSVVPILRSVGLQADWQVISGAEPFFQVTKQLHNALQGAPYDVPPADRETYLSHNALNASLLEGDYDFYVVHDPQPAAIRHFVAQDRGAWVWRCHIDTSQPSQPSWELLREFLEEYDALVFTMQEFVPPDLAPEKVHVIPPAIDPLAPKNLPMPAALCRRIMSWLGVELDRPIITQVSRFDPWKDPLGVVRIYYQARQVIPGLQLALLGQMALDDPEGWEMYRQIVEVAGPDPDVHVLTNFTGVGSMEVNAFQCCSDVVVQKSLREGFGLVVAETLWKGTPVVAHRAGGIALQMAEGAGGYFAESEEEFVERIRQLIEEPQEAQRLGALGRERVRQHFLLPRLVLDELELLRGLAGRRRSNRMKPPAE